jgi:hypothetical protein
MRMQPHQRCDRDRCGEQRGIDHRLPARQERAAHAQRSRQMPQPRCRGQPVRLMPRLQKRRFNRQQIQMLAAKCQRSRQQPHAGQIRHRDGAKWTVTHELQNVHAIRRYASHRNLHRGMGILSMRLRLEPRMHGRDARATVKRTGASACFGCMGRSVVPFHMPTGLADGLGGKSLPRPKSRFAPAGCDRSTSSRIDSDVAGHTPHVGFPAPRRWRRGLGVHKLFGILVCNRSCRD